jgi:hypothetical protein
MTQFDAGPGDWSDRPWEDPEREPKPQAKRRGVALPPWALLAILAAIVIVLCVSLVLIIRAIGGGGDDETPMPAEEIETAEVILPTPTSTLVPIIVDSPTPTVTLPEEGTLTPTPFTEIAVGATVVVQGTGGGGLNLREQPTTYAARVGSAPEGSELLVIEGPSESDGYVWWKVQKSDGTEGWGAGNWLVLK